MSFAQHVNSIACKCYAELRRIKSFRRSLPTDATRTLVNSLVVSKIDYCMQLPACGYACKSHGQTSICYECSSLDCMRRSQKIRSHHKSHERLATLATRPATGDVQVYSQISPRLCTRLFDGTLRSGCTIGTEAPLAISCRRRSRSSRRQQHRSATGPSHMLDHKHGIVFHHSSEPQRLCLCPVFKKLLKTHLFDQS